MPGHRYAHLRAVSKAPALAAANPRESLFDFFVELLVEFEVRKTQKATAPE